MGVTIDCSLHTNQDVKAMIKELVKSNDEIEIRNSSGRNNLLIGIDGSDKRVIVNGNVGYYFLGFSSNISADIYGNTGWYSADSFAGSNISIYGYASTGLGINLQKGEINVFGNAGERVGCLMKGGNIIIHGDVGGYCGNFMMGGNIFVKGDAGDFTGKAMQGGNIFVAGKVGTLEGDVEIMDINQDDYSLIKEYFLNDSEKLDWKKIVSK